MPSFTAPTSSSKKIHALASNTTGSVYKATRTPGPCVAWPTACSHCSSPSSRMVPAMTPIGASPQTSRRLPLLKKTLTNDGESHKCTLEHVFQQHQHIARAVALAGNSSEVRVQLIARNAGVDHADERGQVELDAVHHVEHVGAEL